MEVMLIVASVLAVCEGFIEVGLAIAIATASTSNGAKPELGSRAIDESVALEICKDHKHAGA